MYIYIYICIYNKRYSTIGKLNNIYIYIYMYIYTHIGKRYYIVISIK